MGHPKRVRMERGGHKYLTLRPQLLQEVKLALQMFIQKKSVSQHQGAVSTASKSVGTAIRGRYILVCMLALWMRRWVWGMRLRARWRLLVVMWERFRVLWTRGGVWCVVGLQLDGWRLSVPVLGSVLLRL